jgi:hypothetical protein
MHSLILNCPPFVPKFFPKDLVETYGVYGPQGIKLVKQIGKKNQEGTGEKLSIFFLFQSIPMAIQCSEVHFASGFTTMAVMNPLEKKLKKRTSVG